MSRTRSAVSTRAGAERAFRHRGSLGKLAIDAIECFVGKRLWPGRSPPSQQTDGSLAQLLVRKRRAFGIVKPNTE